MYLITDFKDYGNGIGFTVYYTLKSVSHSFYFRFDGDKYRDQRGIRIFCYLFNKPLTRRTIWVSTSELRKIESLVGCYVG